MATRKKKTRKPKTKEIVQIVSTKDDLFALTDDGGVYRHIDSDGLYGWDELPPITEENILNLNLNDGDEDGEDE